MVFVAKGYTLFERRVALRGGGSTVFYFFSKRKPKSGSPCDLPAGYKVMVNKRTGLPFLKRAGGKAKAPQKAKAGRTKRTKKAKVVRKVAAKKKAKRAAKRKAPKRKKTARKKKK